MAERRPRSTGETNRFSKPKLDKHINETGSNSPSHQPPPGNEAKWYNRDY